MLSTSPFATVICKGVSLKKVIIIWKESHKKGYLVTLIKSLWLSRPLAADRPDTLGILLNIYNILLFEQTQFQALYLSRCCT